MPTVSRKAINRIIPEFAKEITGKVLFVGVYPPRDYSVYFDEFVTLDIRPQFKPTIIGDIQDCPQIPDKSFDGVIMSGVFEFLQEPKKAFVEIYRVLKDSGKALFCMAGCGYYPKSYYPNKLTLEPKDAFDLIKPLCLEKMEITYYKNDIPFYIHLIAKKI